MGNIDSNASAALRVIGADDATLESLNEIAGSLGLQTCDWFAARVARVEHTELALLTGAAEGCVARPSRNEEAAVGDWAVVHRSDNGEAAVLGLVPRRTAIVRRSNDRRVGPQVLAANIDNIVVTLGADQPVNPARLERMLALAWESGAVPVIALAKAELLAPADHGRICSEVGRLALGVSVVSVSAVLGEGLADLLAALVRGGTVVLLGISGAGKSTLVNAMTGAGHARVGALRAGDGKGRHTTAWRELTALPGGGAIIDTPGIRQLGMWVDGTGLQTTFSDVEELADRCRFSDCSHRREPGCAVQAAVASGALDRGRVERYDKLRREAAFIARKTDSRAQKEQRLIWAKRSKESQAHIRRR